MELYRQPDVASFQAWRGLSVCRAETHLGALPSALQPALRILRECRRHLDMSFTRRRLPHACPQGKWLFLTCHLHGSLPHGVYPPPDMASGGRAFVWMDRYLDHASTGPLFLRQPSIASIVIDSLHKGVELGHYD